ncbi:MAG: MFS transporter [SAR202 cluster bacterium]|nr:MFS transporter [SAR202 cluster bacterium]
MITKRFPAKAPDAPAETGPADRERDAKLFMAEVVPSSIPTGVYNNFCNAFALKMGASSSQMGFLAATIELFSMLTQLVAPRLVGILGGRKRMTVIATVFGAIPFAALMVVPFLPAGARVWAAIALLGLAFPLALLSDPAWGSWMSDLVPRHMRGRWMARRGAYQMGIYIVLGLTGALALDRLGDAAKWGFIAAFALALVSRFVSAAIFAIARDPRPGLRLSPAPPPWKMLRHLTAKTNLSGMNRYLMAMRFAMPFAGPFFSIYILNDLGLSYTQFVAAGVISGIAQMTVMPLWGKLADRKGNYFVLVTGAVFFSLWPTLFILVQETWYIFAMYVVLGLAEGGWGMAQYNFVLEHSTDEERSSAVALYRVIPAVGAMLGALVAATIALHMPQIFAYQIMTMFVLSTVLRSAATIALVPRFRPGKASPGPELERQSSGESPGQ